MIIKIKELINNKLCIHSTSAVKPGFEINLSLLNVSWILKVESCYSIGDTNVINCLVKGDIKTLEHIIRVSNNNDNYINTSEDNYNIFNDQLSKIELQNEVCMYESILKVVDNLNTHISDGNNIYNTVCNILLNTLGATYISFYSKSRTNYLMLKHTNCPNVKHHTLIKEYNKQVNGNEPITINKNDITYTKENLKIDTLNRVRSIIYIPIVERNSLYFILLEYSDIKNLSDNQSKYLNIVKDQLINFFKIRGLCRELRNSANRDGLTNLFKKEYLIKRLQEEIEDGNTNYAVCMIDIDDFKNCNDTYGHVYGDLIIKAIADVFKNNTRKSDIVSRFGGEELLCCFLSFNDQRAILNRLETLRLKVTRIRVQPHPYSPSVSIGVYFANSTSTIEDSIASADKLMYAAKKAGKNRLMSNIDMG